MLGILLFSVFITTLIFTFAISGFFNDSQNSILRLKKYIDPQITSKINTSKPKNKEFKSGINIISKSIKDVKFLDSYKKKIQLKLTVAHILLKPEEYISISIIFSLSAFIFASIAAESSDFAIVFAFFTAPLGWLIPDIFLKAKIHKRIQLLNMQLGDAITLISNSLKAGYSFFQAIDVVAKEMTGPVSEEFIQLQKEINVGVTTEKALENLALRIPSNDLELMVTAVLIQRQIGGNLSEILDNISETIRERVKIKMEIKTVTAQGRMSGTVISILPPGIALILFLINKEHISILFTDPLGIAILCFSIIWELLGIFFVSKVVKIEV